MHFLRKESKILDLACGYGRFTIPLAIKGYNVEGIDITPLFIERARREARRHGLEINLRVGDMTDLPYDSDSFDTVICMWNAFSELANDRDQIKGILEIYRVMKAGGMAIVEVRNHRSSGLIEANVIDGKKAMPGYNHTRGSMRRLMRLSQIENYRVFVDEFGGRNRLFLEIKKSRNASD